MLQLCLPRTAAAFRASAVNPARAVIAHASSPPRLALQVTPVDAFAAYTDALRAAPLATNVVTASLLATFSDSIAQTMERRRSGGEWNVERSAWQSVWGAAMSGCVIFYWLRWLATVFPRAKSSGLQLLGKVGLNQLVMSPGLNGGFFLFVILTRTPPKLRMDGAKWTMLMSKYRTDLLGTCLRSCAFWSVVQGVNFRFLPAMYGGDTCASNRAPPHCVAQRVTSGTPTTC